MADTKKPNVGEAILGKNKQAIGSYQEAPGGGTPLKAGEKAPSKEWVAANRKMQPRDDDGKFTYNAANAKPLEYGPSRGWTVPPFLRGIKLTYVKKSDVIMTEEGKRVLAGIDMTREQLINNFKEYSEQEGGFKNLSSATQSKTGAFSKKEKIAKEMGYEGLLKNLTIQDLTDDYKENKESGKLKGKFKDVKKLSEKPQSNPEPKKEVAPEAPKSDVTSEEKELASTDPVKLFATSDNAKALRKKAEEKGLNLSGKAVAKAIADGYTWGDLNKVVDEA